MLVVAVVASATAVVLNVSRGENQATDGRDNSLTSETECLVTEDSGEHQDAEAGRTEDNGQSVLVLGAADGECHQADRKDNNQHDQVKRLLIEQRHIENRENRQDHGQGQAVQHADA